MICLVAGMAACHRDPFPWTSYEAEVGRTNAAVHGPSREYRTPEAESSGRKYVRLAAEGDYVEIRAERRGNTVNVRYCIPDSKDGGGMDATLSLYINGRFEKRLKLTSRHAWSYGDFPWSNDPAMGKAHHYFDECHATVSALSPGDLIRLQKDGGDTAKYYLLDLIEFEEIGPPLPQPHHSLSITEFGARPDDTLDDSTALVKCLEKAAAERKTVWIPPGEFLVNGPRIRAGDVRVQGAGMWYSTLAGTCPEFEGTGAPVVFSDLAISGNINHRNDESPDNAFTGNFGQGSLFKNLWIEHVKCGFWTTQGTSRMQVERCRIRNTMADGLNFCDGTSRSIVRECHLRNTGDDALATWSPAAAWSSRLPCVENAFLHNSIELPWHANGIAIYGGGDHLIADNTVTGTVYSGGGILISSGFGALPFSGAIRVRNNSLSDAGGDCYIGGNVGALWIHAMDSDILSPVLVSGLRISDPAGAPITVHGPKKVTDLHLKDVEVRASVR